MISSDVLIQLNSIYAKEMKISNSSFECFVKMSENSYEMSYVEYEII